MILAHGKPLPDSALPALLDRLEGELSALRIRPTLSPNTVLSALDRLRDKLDRGELDSLLSQYLPAAAREQLGALKELLSPKALGLRLELELPQGFDAAPRPFGQALTLPLGVLFHVAAGNVPGLPAYTVLEGLLTGIINLLKLPRGDNGLSLAVLLKLAVEEPALAPYIYAFDVPSGDTPTLRRLAALADGVVTWGSGEAVAAVRAIAPPGCKLIEWGHRLSFAYLSGYEDRAGELRALAEHIITTGGLLCSSCQVIFLDTDSMEEARGFCLAFLPVLEEAAGRLRSPDDAAQAALYAYEAMLEHVTGPNRGRTFFPGRGCSLTLGEDRALELSPLHGNVLVKRLPRDALAAALAPHRGRLQTAGLICAPDRRAELIELLARIGVVKISRAGHMSAPFPGEAHDGEYSLRRYTRIVDVEK